MYICLVSEIFLCLLKNVTYCLVAGDLNTVLDRLQSHNTSHLLEFTKEENLVLFKTLQCSIPCTFVNSTNGTSFIDHVLVSSNLVP